MLKGVLPYHIYEALDKVGFNNICEIRLRVGRPVIVFIATTKYYLQPLGVSESKHQESIVLSYMDIKYVIDKISNGAYHSISDSLINGYITLSNGVRIGVSGKVISIDGVIKNISNISSLCIRIPHMVKNCSLSVYKYLVNKSQVYSTLIVSSPGAGKTTFLKDFIYQLDHRCKDTNITVLDERQELVVDIENLDNVDVYIPTSRLHGFDSVIRSMSPKVIVIDELGFDDFKSVAYAISSGVSVVASIHASSIESVQSKFKQFGIASLFDRYVVLTDKEQVGQVYGVYNKEFMPIYL